MDTVGVYRYFSAPNPLQNEVVGAEKQDVPPPPPPPAHRPARHRYAARWVGTTARPLGPGCARRCRARHKLGNGLLTLAAGLAAAIPVISATVKAVQAGWVPVADRGIIATRAHDVFTSHAPLVGQYSLAGEVTGRVTHSLGPMLFWLLAPTAYNGSDVGMTVTMGALNTALHRRRRRARPPARGSRADGDDRRGDRADVPVAGGGDLPRRVEPLRRAVAPSRC